MAKTLTIMEDSSRSKPIEISTDKITLRSPKGFLHTFWIDKSDFVKSSEEAGQDNIISLMEESIDYDKVVWLRVNENYFEYLREALHMADNHGEPYSFDFFFNFMQGNIDVIKPFEDHVDLILWLEPGSVEEELLKVISRGQNFVKHGLYKLLDLNEGGGLSEDNIRLASTIIYG
jgi:hypothetical protein